MQTHRKAAQMIEPHDFLLPDPTLRRRPAMPQTRVAPVEDAVFEVVTPRDMAKPDARQHRRMTDKAPPHNPSANRTPYRQAAPRFELLPAIAGVGGRAAVATETWLSQLSPQAFVTLLSSLVLAVFWICGGFSALGATDSATLAGRQFALVNTSVVTEDANGMTLARVTGAVKNTSGAIIVAPRLAVVSGSHQDIIGTVLLTVDRIGPGMTIPFSGRFKLAGGKSADISVIPEHR